MAFQPETDDLSTFEAKETSKRIPVGWALLFWGLVAFGLYYLWAYTPGLGGWQQAQDVEAGSAPGSSVLATILFTAIAAAVAAVLLLVQRRKRAR